ncbi:hypothetical protein VSDG_01148 [Cytospora chrysosperma]|uniref:Uncharacterized protein n=1 Tax=Cytospora chrysosperma TaxID=252740 RepID=A0A423WKZ5_CYTCH|nr:hypothetical protein VSDG_01148 [Valsa sordida]
MWPFIVLSTLVSLAMSQSLVLEAQDGTCGYLNGVRLASYGCQSVTQKCAVYYPTSSLAADVTSNTDISLASMNTATPSFKTLTPRAAASITPAPQVDYPAVVCCDPSLGDCTAQPTACVDVFEHPSNALCTGSCLNNPMTLKCTAGHALHCNQIRFQSPLQYQRNAEYAGAIDSLEARIGVAGGPARGWFCGDAALPTRFVESTVISRRPVFEDESSSLAAAEVVTGSPGGMISQSTTLSSTITLSPTLSPPPRFNPSTVETGVVSSGDYTCDLAATGGEDCCIDEPALGEDCCVDEPASGEDCCSDGPTRRARQIQRRRDPELHRVGITVVTSTVTSPNQIGLATTTVTPAAAPVMVITEGFAVVSTTYLNQSDRSPFAEATRSWNIVVPTLTLDVTATSTTTTVSSNPRWPDKQPKKHHGPAHISRIVGGVLGSLSVLLLLCIIVDWCKRRRKLAKKQLSKKEEEDDHDRTVSRSDRTRNYLWDRHAGVKDRLSWFEDQQNRKSTPPTIPPRSLRSDNSPERYTTPMRDGIHSQGVIPQGQQASSLPGDCADGDGAGANGSNPDLPFYHAINRMYGTAV